MPLVVTLTVSRKLSICFLKPDVTAHACNPIIHVSEVGKPQVPNFL